MDELIFAGNKYISSKRAGKLMGYTTDYIGQMCRGGKMACKLVGRNWYINDEAVKGQKKSFKKEQLKEADRAIEYKKIDLEPMYYSNDDRSNNINLNKKPIVVEEKEKDSEEAVQINSRDDVQEITHSTSSGQEKEEEDIVSVLHMIESPVVDLREVKQEAIINPTKQIVKRKELLPQKSPIRLPISKVLATILVLLVLLFVASTLTLQQTIRYASSGNTLDTEYQLAGVTNFLDF